MMSECGILPGISKKPSSQAQYSKTGPQQNLLMLVGTPAVRERERGEERRGGREDKERGREGERRGGSREERKEIDKINSSNTTDTIKTLLSTHTNFNYCQLSHCHTDTLMYIQSHHFL